ncbi:MAG: hypothetical protein C4576_35430 [Desulfobacteraceae bacterium]|nr:MAG: hypothetical protein C4576_35430 [Desulfobacteraceae bacterium]
MNDVVESSVSKTIQVELINHQGIPETMELLFSSDEGSMVSAGVFKQRVLNLFDASSPLLEPEEETDENRSYHLLAVDEEGRRHAVSDETSFDIHQYSRFELSPRTTGGSRRSLR